MSCFRSDNRADKTQLVQKLQTRHSHVFSSMGIVLKFHPTFSKLTMKMNSTELSSRNNFVLLPLIHLQALYSQLYPTVTWCTVSVTFVTLANYPSPLGRGSKIHCVAMTTADGRGAGVRHRHKKCKSLEGIRAYGPESLLHCMRNSNSSSSWNKKKKRVNMWKMKFHWLVWRKIYIHSLVCKLMTHSHMETMYTNMSATNGF